MSTLSKLLYRASTMMQCGHVAEAPRWYNIALLCPPSGAYPVRRPPAIRSSYDRLHRAFDREFKRRHGKEPNLVILPTNPDNPEECNYRLTLTQRWHALLEERQGLSLSEAFDMASDELTDLLEESKTKLVCHLRTYLDPKDKFAGQPIQNIIEHYHKRSVDKVVAKRRRRYEYVLQRLVIPTAFLSVVIPRTIIGATGKSESADAIRMKMLVADEIERRRTAGDWSNVH